jgi:hypothetical protein
MSPFIRQRLFNLALGLTLMAMYGLYELVRWVVG